MPIVGPDQGSNQGKSDGNLIGSGAGDLLDTIFQVLDGNLGVRDAITGGSADRIEALRKAQEEANAAAEARYAESLGINKERQDLANANLNEIGAIMQGRVEHMAKGLQEAQRILGEVGSNYKKNANNIGEQLRGRAKNVEAGYDAARSEIDVVGNKERRDIDIAKDQNNQQAVIDATSIGGASTLLPSMRRANEMVAQRMRNDLTESVAGLRSGLQENKTKAVASAWGDVADFSRERAGVEAQLGTAASELQAGKTAAVDSKIGDLTDFMKFRSTFTDDLLEDRSDIIASRSDQINTALGYESIAAQSYAAAAQGSGGGGGGGGGGDFLSTALNVASSVLGL